MNKIKVSENKNLIVKLTTNSIIWQLRSDNNSRRNIGVLIHYNNGVMDNVQVEELYDCTYCTHCNAIKMVKLWIWPDTFFGNIPSDPRIWNVYKFSAGDVTNRWFESRGFMEFFNIFVTESRSFCPDCDGPLGILVNFALQAIKHTNKYF